MKHPRIAELDKEIAAHRLLHDQPAMYLRELEREREDLLAAPEPKKESDKPNG